VDIMGAVSTTDPNATPLGSGGGMHETRPKKQQAWSATSQRQARPAEPDNTAILNVITDHSTAAFRVGYR